MRVIEISSPGPADVLCVADRPNPIAGPGEVLITIEAAGVNRPDLMQREGLYPPPKGASDIPGLEVAGRIVALGPGEPRSASGRVWRVGDEVCALLTGGGYAEACAVSGLQCLPIPAGLSMIEAAALPETHFTVWTNVVERGRLASGETLLVHGGASGIGTTAIQLAAARGAAVIATAGSDERCRRCESLGARAAINYRSMDFVEAVKAITNNRGVDVILDIIGGEYTARNLACLARDGRLVQIGLMGGASATIPLAPIILRRLTITGSTLRIRTPEEKGAIAAALEREVWPLLASGRMKPIVDRTFPLADAPSAHRVLESGQIFGKVVLRNDTGSHF
ncbi:MAG: NAD(P)H-quinone oxidoreductase [Acidobacteria bacterium]|nr:MAG: NAD(P)H-quinone oxidoreductase [Acidobacteriota bacterium]